MSINVVDRINALISVKHILLSISDKNGLDKLIPGMHSINPEIKIFSKG